MANLLVQHTIKPAPGADGPFWVETASSPQGSTIPPVVSNVTLGIATINAALDQCKTDGAALLGGFTVDVIKITTQAHN